MDKFFLTGIALLGLIANSQYLQAVENPSTSTLEGVDPINPPEQYIISGEDATWREYPWMGALVVNNSSNSSQFCGCTAIDPFWVLTAAHCMDDGREPDDFKVLFGPGVLGNDPSVQLFKADAIVMHPKYSSIYDLQYDIALVKLKTPLPESIPILPLISDLSLEQAGKTAKITGWGRTNYDFREPMYPSFLQEADVELFSREFANGDDFFQGFISENLLAAGSFDPYISAHFGDSGGPLLGFNSDLDRWEQIGTLSFGASCDKASNPINGFTRLSQFKPWINEVIGNDFFSWLRQNGIDSFNHDDGDSNAPLMEYIFGLDPNKGDAINWYPRLETNPETGNQTISLAVRLRREIPRLGFLFEQTFDLNSWDALELPWDKFAVEKLPDSHEAFYQIPLVSRTSPGGFYRLTHQDFRGILYGPHPLRVGSSAYGLFNHELNATGITRYDYLIDNLGLLNDIRMTVVSDIESPIRLRIVDFETGKVKLDVEGDATVDSTTNSAVTGILVPEPGKQYLARVESSQYSNPQKFKINAERGGAKVVLIPGTPVNGSLSPTDTHYKRSNHFADTFRVELQANTNYIIEVRTEEFDPIFFVSDIATTERLQEVDEGPPGEPEYVLIRTGELPNVELTVSSWRPEEQGDYTIEVNPFPERNSIKPGEQTIGFFNSADQQSGTFYVDYIGLDLAGTQTPITVQVKGFDNFRPIFGVFNVTDEVVLNSQLAWCEDEYFSFNPEEGKIYRIAVLTGSSDLGENYWLEVVEGNSSEQFLTHAFTKSHREFSPPLAGANNFDFDRKVRKGSVAEEVAGKGVRH